MAILGDTSMVSDGDDDGDRIHSEYSDEDEDDHEARWQLELGAPRDGEFPARVRWLRRKRLLHLLMTRGVTTMKRHGGAGDAVGKTANPRFTTAAFRKKKKK